MKNVIAIIVSLVIMTIASVTNAANIKDYPTVAVMNFGNKAVTSSGFRDTDFSSATEYAIYQLSNSGWFDLVDYEQLATIAKMQRVQLSGLIDQNTAVQMGKVLGAQFMVVGNVTGLTAKESGVNVQAGRRGGVGGNKYTVTANVTLRIVDIETGRIIVSGLGSGSSSSSNMEVVFKKYRRKRNSTGVLAAVPNDITNDLIFLGDDYTYSEEGEIPNNDDEETTNTENDKGSNLGEAVAVIGGAIIADRVEQKIDDILNDTIPNPNANDYSTSENIPGTINNSDSYYDVEEYKITIGTREVSDVQVRNAISKAVRDGIYGKMGILTTLNGGKPVKAKTGF